MSPIELRPVRPRADDGAPAPRERLLRRMWRVLEGRRALDLSVLLISGCTALLTVLGLVMVLSSSSVEAIGTGGGSYALFLRQTAWAVAGVGVLLRLVVWGQARSVYLDEVNLLRNFLERDYAGLFRPLGYEQYAPPLFSVLMKAVVQALGTGERAIRLVPVLAGCGMFDEPAEPPPMPTPPRQVRLTPRQRPVVEPPRPAATG